MIPEFPAFKKIEITDKEEIENFTKDFPPYSDFNFISLFCWDIENKREISMLNRNLVVKLTDDMGGNEFCSILGNNKITESVILLLTNMKEYRMKPSLRMVPQEIANVYFEPSAHLKIIEDRDNFDYVYSTEELSCFTGSKYGDVRNLNNRFIKKYGDDFNVKSFDLSNESNKKCLVDLCKEWSEIKEIYISREEIAIQRLLSNSKSFNLVNIMIFVKNKPIAFTVNEVLNNNFAISHFAKANYLYSGINATLLKETSRKLLELGCKSLNYEEDLGLPGLRRAKESFKPVYFLKKYKISSKTGLIERMKSMLY